MRRWPQWNWKRRAFHRLDAAAWHRALADRTGPPHADGKFRDECLNEHWLTSMSQARDVIADIAHGHQPVNNGPTLPARADAIENRPNELLDGEHGERLDRGTAGPAGASDPAMATVATIHGAPYRCRQGRRQS
jgi:hypothetical protein